MLRLTQLPWVRTRTVRWIGACLALGLVTIAATGGAAPAQQGGPADEPPALDPPSIIVPLEDDQAPLAEPVLPAPPRGSDRARDQIRDALQGNDPDAAATGDPLLDDVIGIIRRQGSILDGTVLDPTDRRAGADSAPLGFDQTRYQVAESLLRAARLLSSLPDPEGDRQALVRQMRAEAVRCLTSP